MKKLIVIPLLLASFILHKTLYGQNDTLYFKHFSADQGLSQNNVSSIIQDSLGFMWYGTKAGLNKFDGYSFVTFKHDPKVKNSLVSDDISCMSVEKSGVIWIGTKMKGVNQLNPYSGNFTVYQHIENDANSISDDLITAIHVDNTTGFVWIGTANSGLNVYDPKQKKFTLFVHADNSSVSISDNAIACITHDSTGHIFIGTAAGGMNEYDPLKKKFTVYMHKVSNPNSLSSNNVRDIFVDKSNKVWVATDAGLNVLNRSERTIRIFRHSANDRYSLCSDNITSVYQDKAGKIWAGTANNGLNVYYPDAGRFYLYSHETTENTLSSNNINRISQGRSGMFWAATRDGGLNAFNPKSLKFKLLNPFAKYGNEQITEKIACIYECNNSNLWCTTDDGLFCYHPESGKLIHYNDRTSLNQHKVSEASTLDKEKGKDISESLLPEQDLATDKTPPVNLLAYAHSVYSDSKNIMWIVSNDNKLIVYDNNAKKIIPAPCNIASRKISCFMHDHSGMIWIGTYGDGLYNFNTKTGVTSTFKNNGRDLTSIGSNYINGICEDKKGTVWISAWCGGLNSFQRAENNFVCYTTQDGLPVNSIGAILADDSNNIWAATDNGICRITFENGRIKQCRVFDVADGLPNVEFYNGVSVKRKNGAMVFSCKKGLVSFFPDSLKNNPYKPPVVITDFKLFNKSVLPGDLTGILKLSISITKEILLNYQQNFFSFEFTAMSFINARKNRYAYKMEGFDKDWIYTTADRRFATYTNLSPGDYTFRVIASNNDGVWNEEGTSLHITITPPFWKSWWFYTITGIILVSCIGLYIRLRTGTLKKQKLVLEQKVEHRTAQLKEKNEELVKTMHNLKSMQDQLIHSEKMASLGQLTAGIAHEIQNPLNFVNNFSIVAVELLEDFKQASLHEKDNIVESLKINLEKITHHGQRADRIVKGMLMHSRTGSSEKQATDINKLIEDSLILAYTGIRANDKLFKCELKTDYDSHIPSVNLMPQDISRVLINIINNAFYAMNEKKKNDESHYYPTLSLSTSLHDQLVSIRIADNGPGISNEIRDKIFQPFFTTKPTGEGTGLGLSLSYDIIVKRHSGEIKIESTEGKGTEFIILLAV